jgi:hypothetical protein
MPEAGLNGGYSISREIFQGGTRKLNGFIRSYGMLHFPGKIFRKPLWKPEVCMIPACYDFTMALYSIFWWKTKGGKHNTGHCEAHKPWVQIKK